MWGRWVGGWVEKAFVTEWWGGYVCRGWGGRALEGEEEETEEIAGQVDWYFWTAWMVLDGFLFKQVVVVCEWVGGRGEWEEEGTGGSWAGGRLDGFGARVSDMVGV